MFSSSCTVYGEPSKLPITEEAPFKVAESPYGATKQMCETILKDSCKSGDIKSALSLRYFNPIGAHPSAKIGELPIGVPANLIPFVTQAAAGLRKQLTVYGDNYDTPDGTCIRDYIHVVDLAKAHVSALELLFSKSTFYDYVNVGTGQGISVMEIIKTFEQVNSVKVPYKIGPRRPGDIVEIYADTTKANKLLKWSAKLSPSDALKDAWRWQKTL